MLLSIDDCVENRSIGATEKAVMSQYRIVSVPEDDGGYSVQVPALPGCFTQGDSREEAVAMAKEAISLHIEAL